MKISLSLITILLAGALAPATPAMAQDTSNAVSSEQADRVALRRFARQVRHIDRESEQLMQQAVQEARDNDGKANKDTKARLLSLRDERDRLFSRMLVLSMRHGWEIPDLDKSSARNAEREDYEKSIFGPVDELVRRRFAAEALRIVHMTRLPVVSLESMASE